MEEQEAAAERSFKETSRGLLMPKKIDGAFVRIPDSADPIPIEGGQDLKPGDEARVAVWIEDGKHRARYVPYDPLWHGVRDKYDSGSEGDDANDAPKTNSDAEEDEYIDEEHYIEEEFIPLDKLRLVDKNNPDPYTAGFAAPIETDIRPSDFNPFEKTAPTPEELKSQGLHLFGGRTFKPEECTEEAVRKRGPPEALVKIWEKLNTNISKKYEELEKREKDEKPE